MVVACASTTTLLPKKGTWVLVCLRPCCAVALQGSDAEKSVKKKLRRLLRKDCDRLRLQEKKRENDWAPLVVAAFRDSYSPGHDGFCCVQLSILEFPFSGVRLFARNSCGVLGFG